MAIEKLVQVQMALFFETLENRPDKIANKIEDAIENVFDQMPNIIPLPSDAPPEIPRVVMNSSDRIFTCNISKLRADFIGNFSNLEDEIDVTIDNFLDTASKFLKAVINVKRIIRFGLVGQYFFEEQNLTEKLKHKYFRPDIGDFDELNLKFNKRFEFDGIQFNDVVDIIHGFLTGPNGIEIKGGFIQKDINNIPSNPLRLDTILNLIENKKVTYYEKQIRELIN